MAGAFQSNAFQSDAFEIDTSGGSGQLGEIDLNASATLELGGELRVLAALAVLGSATFSPSAGEPPASGDAGFQSDAFQNDAFQTVIVTGGDGDLDVLGSGLVEIAGQRVVEALVAVAGSATFTLNGSLTDNLEGFLAVTGTAALAGSVSVLEAGALAATASGSLSQDGELVTGGHSVLGELLASASAAFTGTPTRTMSGALAPAGSAAFSGTPGGSSMSAELLLEGEAFFRNPGDTGGIADPFDRTDPASWGEGPLGEWTQSSGSFSVVDGIGAATGSTSVWNDIKPAPFPSSDKWSSTVRFQWPADFRTFTSFSVFWYEDPAFNHDVYVQVQAPVAGAPEPYYIFVAWDSPTGSEDDLVILNSQPQPNEWWYVTIEWVDSTRTVRAKAWKDGTPEPDWMVSRNDIDFARAEGDPWTYELYMFNENVPGSNPDSTWHIDSVGLDDGSTGTPIVDHAPTGVPYADTAASQARDIVITVNGVDITQYVRFRDATFQSQVNGAAAPCQFAVRDLDHTQGFTTGHKIVLTVDGIRRWTGFVSTIQRQYSFPAVDTSSPNTVPRWFLIKGVDINILLAKRVMYNKANPARGELPVSPAWRDSRHPDQWQAGTPAGFIVRYLLRYATDLLDDGIDISEITLDDSPNPDFAGAYSGAMTIRDWMMGLNKLVGGVFYITPDERFKYHAVETATTNFVVTDAPGSQAVIEDAVGVADYNIYSDASQMVNDALIWGTAPGVSTVAFARERDSVELARHGLWQFGEFNETMYKQSSVNRRANAIVYGNVQSRLGAHYDRIGAEATTYAPVLFLGDVARCEQHVYDGTQYPPLDEAGFGHVAIDLPVRRMVITFPTPTSVRWQMLLTQELDDPWNIYEYVFPPFPGFPIPHVEPPPPPLLPGALPCSEAFYAIGLINLGTITTTGPFVDNGAAWFAGWTGWPVAGFPVGSDNDQVGVFANQGYLTLSEAVYGQQLLYSPTVVWNREAFTATFKFKLDAISTGTVVTLRLGAATVDLSPSTTSGFVTLIAGDLQSTSQVYNSWAADTYYLAKLTVDLVTNSIRVVFGPEGGSTITLQRAAAGEHVGDGTYKPIVGVRFNNPGSTPIRFTLDSVLGSAFANSYQSDPSLFGGGSGTSGWGSPWVTYQGSGAAGVDAGLTYDADGSVRVLNAGLRAGGWIARPLVVGAGSIDVGFSIANYSPAAANVLALHFQQSGSTKTQRAFIGNTLQLATLNGSTNQSTSGSTTLFNSGNPVNVRVQFNNGGMRIKLWASGTDQPDAWTVTHFRAFTVWPPNSNLTTVPSNVLGVMYNGPNTTGNKATLGSIVNATSASPSWLVQGPVNLSDTLYRGPFTLGAAAGRARSKSWPFADPGDGRQYAVTWGQDQYVVTNDNSPDYFFELVWGQFGDLGPGVPRQALQEVAGISVTQPVVAGVDAEFELLLEADFRMAMQGQSSGPGAAQVTAALETYNYDVTATTAPPPAVTDYFILSNRDERYFTMDLEEGGALHLEHFTQTFDSQQQDGYGLSPLVVVGSQRFRVLLLGTKILDPISKIQEAGPFDQNGFLSVHTGSLDARVVNGTYTLRLRGVPAFGVLKADPCLPIPLTSGSETPATSGTGANADFTNGEIVYHLGTSYVPGSVMLWLNGLLMIPLVDFEETDYLAGIVTLLIDPHEIPIGAVIHIDWTILGGPI